ncbi:MAG: acetamidase/formamidase family protein [Acidobacteriota bacterium]|nr:acetamidase/formamidase family protein [Acidobacteriota bacterium]
MPTHTLTAQPTHSLWDASLPPRLHISSGDAVHLECVDSSGAQVSPASTLADFLAIDRTRIHALTGPIFLDGAAAGDTLQIDVLEVAHKGWAWSSIIPGLGLLDQRFTEAFLFQWKLEQTATCSLEPAVIPLSPFLGVMGVAPPEPGAHRTRPPGPFGGNLDVRELCSGSTLYLPVFQPGALFSAGDAHAAQGDGEVCINGMECPADATLRFTLHKGRSIPGPIVESVPKASGSTGPEWIVVESATDAFAAAQAATSRMVDLLVEHWHLPPNHAYLLCSVAMKLRLSQVVNRPMTTVSAAIPKAILPALTLFA